MRHLLLTTIIFILTFCYSQKVTIPIDKWKAYDVPVNEDTLSIYNHAQDDWTVFLKDSKIYATNNRNKTSDSLPFKIIPTEEERYRIGGSRSVIKVDNGYLVGFYRGEWGGNLYWFSQDGKNKYEISDHEIVQFIKRDNKIYAIEGLAHLDMSAGSIIEIKEVNKKWTAVEHLKLPSAPDGIDLATNNNFVIITSKSLLTVDTNFKIDTLIEKGFWRAALYPTSLVIKDSIAYMGMRKGVFKYDLTTNKQEWLMIE